MKFALLGADSDTLALARAVNGNPAHELVWFGAPLDAWDKLAPFGLKLRPDASWEVLLGGTIADAVIVGRTERAEEQAERLVRLVQGGLPVLSSLPVPAALLTYFEIDSVRGDPPRAVVPTLGWRWHPAVARLRAICDGSPGQEPSIGRVEQLVFERFLADRTRKSVLGQFAADVDLVQTFTGDLTHLGAMAPGDARNEDKPRFDNLGVQAYGPRGVMLRWSAGPIEDTAGARLSLLGASGRVVLEAPTTDSWRLEVRLRDPRTDELEKTPRVEEFPLWEPSTRLLEYFVEQATRRIDADAPATEGPTWADATRAAELAEAIDRSIARRRTIEVRVERESESSAFKGTMAAVGCSLLLLSLLLFVVGVILGNKPFGFVWAGRFVIFSSVLLMMFFLALQGLGAIVPRREKEDRPP